ncbi:MAG: flagellar hook-length control protein FliK, partial [Ignavibacterium album]
HEIKTQLLNNKTIIEHFIKSPVVSKTIERFIQIIDAQQAIHKSEIVSYSKQNHSVEIKLAPEELGRIKILIDTNDNNVSAKIEVGNEQTKAIVVNNLPQLKESLSQQGVNLNNVNVSVTSEEQKNSEQTKQKSRKKSQEHHSGVERAEEKKTVRNLGYNTYEYLA